MSKSWLLRAVPHGIRRMDEFKNSNIIAIGWPGISNLKGKNREQLKEILSLEPYNLKSLELGNAYATVDIFVNQMNINDLVLVIDGDDIHFCEILSDYLYDKTKDKDDIGYPHQRSVKWLNKTQRNKLPKELRSSLKVHRTTADLSHHSDLIRALAHNEDVDVKKNQFVNVEYPLRPDLSIKISVPKDITKVESIRLSDFIKTLYFDEQ